MGEHQLRAPPRFLELDDNSNRLSTDKNIKTVWNGIKRKPVTGRRELELDSVDRGVALTTTRKPGE